MGRALSLFGLASLLVGSGAAGGLALVACSSSSSSASAAGSDGGGSANGGNGTSTSTGDDGGSSILADGGVTCGGPLDPASFQALAANLSSDEAIAFRYGGGCAARVVQMNSADAAAAPHQCERAHQQLEVQPNTFFTYELGAQDPSKDDYSMSDGQFVAVASDLAAAVDAGDPGVEHFTSVIMGQGVFGESAQPTWDYYGHNTDVAFGAANGADDAGVGLAGGFLNQPVAIARGYSGWSEDALVVTNSGVVGTGGTFTGRTYQYFAFPSDKRPVGVALTNNNEFALFTIWDTSLAKSQVAVVALGAGGNFWGDWTETYPGLENDGMYEFAKILGYVDLPGIADATEITAASDFNLCDDLPYACWLANHQQFSDLTLSTEANRQTFVGDTLSDATGNAGAYSEAGFAAILAPAENKVVVLDLAPLFAKVKQMYFTTTDNFAKTQAFGADPSAWPYTFAVAPDFAPTVAQVLELPGRPTAVKASPWDSSLLVTTVDGTLHVFDVGTIAGRHAAKATDAGAVSTGVTDVGQVAVGANVTSIVEMKHDWPSPTVGAPRRAFMALSRAEKRIDWVHVSPTGAPSIDRTLRDDRMVDPIALEDADNHGTESYVVSVADYGGKQILNYRYGPVTYYTNGGDRFDMCADGGGAFELGGALPASGKPFALSVSNTP